MKKCPKCRTEYTDSMEICPNDDTVLEVEGAPAEENAAAQTETHHGTETPATEPVREVTAAATATSAGQNSGMSALAKSLVVILVLLGIGAGLVFWKSKVGGHSSAALNKISKEDMAVLLKDANPMQLKQLSENPEAKKKIADNIRQLLAVASQARKEGIADEPNIKTELENIRTVLTATIYDQKINGDKGPMPPFGYITEDQTKEFWNDQKHDAEFKEFLDSKIALAKESGKFPKDKELTEDEIKQAKDDYAKIRIYEAEAKAKAGELGEEFNRELELQIKLQQSQFLASQYAQKTLTEKVKVSDEEVQAYIAAHPEFSPAEKKAKAEATLKRVQGGEDFAKVADEISEDPGTKGKGGLYKDVSIGKMMPSFEQAALALEPGKIADQLVETPYGFHIIKLERKGETKGTDGKPAQTYDVRHILIGTTIADPKNPMARPMPANEMARQTLETEKQKKVLDEIVANNPVEVAEDFDIPQPTDEQMQQMMQQQQMMQGGGMPPQDGMPPSASAGDEDAPKGNAKPKSAPKKK
jgi:peptidyl-prolyl cis-trans isomerase C